MAIERQAVQGLPQVQATSPNVMTFAPQQVGGVEAGVASTSGSRFIEDLIRAASSVADVTTGILNQKIEEDKVVQMERAYNGLMPSEDATRGGARANMLVKAQLLANDEAARMKDMATRFQGTDDEWTQLMVDSRNEMQNKLFQQYPELQGDKDTMRMVTNVFQEQQPQIWATRTQHKLDREQADREDTFDGRVASTWDSSIDPEASGYALQERIREGLTQGLLPEQMHKKLVERAISLAQGGDISMAEALKYVKDDKGVSVYAKNPQLITAITNGNAVWARNNVADVTRMSFEVKESYLAGDLTDEELLERAQHINSLTGNSVFSNPELEALMRQRAKQNAELGAMQDMRRELYSDRMIGLQGKSDKEKKAYVDLIKQDSQLSIDQQIKQRGIDPYSQEAEAIRGAVEVQRLQFMNSKGLVDDTFESRIKAMESMLSPEHFAKGEPQELMTIRQLWEQLPEESRGVFGDTVNGYMDNYNTALQMGETPLQAARFAREAQQKFSRTEKETKKFNSAIGDALDEVSGAGWFDGKTEVSDLGKAIAEEELRAKANMLWSSGMRNMDSIKKALITWGNKRYTQSEDAKTSGGYFIKGDYTSASDMLMSVGKGVNPTDVPLALGRYVETQMPELKKELQEWETKDDVYIDYNEQKGTFVIRAGAAGRPLSGVIPVTSLDTTSLLDSAYQKRVEERDKGEYVHPYRTDIGAQEPMPAKPTAKDIGKFGLANFLMSSAFASGENLPSNFEINYRGNMQQFYDKLAMDENKDKVGFNNATGTFTPYKDAHGESIGYGHFLTEEEKRNGYIKIGDELVPYRGSMSQLTESKARALMEQDAKKHVPPTRDWKIPFDQMHPAQQRGLMDLTYNLGKGGIQNSPRALAAFKAGKLTEGFIEMLGTASSEGKRIPGLLKRRAEAYNMASAGGVPKITEVETREDGSMWVKFSGPMPAGSVSAWTHKRIGADGWYQVYEAAPTKLAKGAKVGKVKL